MLEHGQECPSGNTSFVELSIVTRGLLDSLTLSCACTRRPGFRHTISSGINIAAMSCSSLVIIVSFDLIHHSRQQNFRRQ
jgi:hypothetical protein